jgi:hypothetical protein
MAAPTRTPADEALIAQTVDHMCEMEAAGHDLYPEGYRVTLSTGEHVVWASGRVEPYVPKA